MSRIGIITFLHNDNYGSSLQAYALQRVIREMGHECEHIDYQPDRMEKALNLLLSGNNLKLVLEGIRKREVKAEQAGARRKSQTIPAFYRKWMKMSDPCRNRRALRHVSRKYDSLVCGSDQIWNPVWLNPAYFLNFAGKDQKKTAYAVSLGISVLPKTRKIRKIRRWIEGFSAVSVREQEGAELLKKMTGIKADVMPDPVCLLSVKEWKEMAEQPPEGEPYLLCYFIGENSGYWDKVRRLSAETGLRVLVIPVTAGSYQSGYETLEGLGPEAFLGAISGATCFCTDSFHGLAFGTIFGIRTEIIRRYSEDDPESKNSRVDQFLRLTGSHTPEELRRTGRDWLKKHLS